ncbi:unnamed protein product [Closterium sp. Naga37s-1]|nr:unnamed protein product [Closterium sp. Naga37s-1]
MRAIMGGLKLGSCVVDPVEEGGTGEARLGTREVMIGGFVLFRWFGQMRDVQQFPNKQAFDSCDFSRADPAGGADVITVVSAGEGAEEEEDESLQRLRALRQSVPLLQQLTPFLLQAAHTNTHLPAAAATAAAAAANTTGGAASAANSTSPASTATAATAATASGRAAAGDAEARAVAATTTTASRHGMQEGPLGAATAASGEEQMAAHVQRIVCHSILTTYTFPSPSHFPSALSPLSPPLFFPCPLVLPTPATHLLPHPPSHAAVAVRDLKDQSAASAAVLAGYEQWHADVAGRVCGNQQELMSRMEAVEALAGKVYKRMNWTSSVVKSNLQHLRAGKSFV